MSTIASARPGLDGPSRAGRLHWVAAEPEGAPVPDLAVVCVSWNVRDLLLANLAALEESVGPYAARFILVDNASGDGTVEAVRRRFPWVTVVANAENRGFSAACNQGIAATRARHALLLNPDMRLDPETLADAIAYADAHPEAGIFSAHLFDAEGKEVRSVRRFPDLWSQLAILLKLAKVFPGLVRRYHADDLDLSVEQDVDSFRGSFFFIQGGALRLLGGLDERYFIWFEEVDYCRRARAYGLLVRHVPRLRAHDAVGRSFAQRRLLWKQDRFTASMVRYFETWEPWWQAFILRVVRLPVLAAAWAYDRIRFGV